MARRDRFVRDEGGATTILSMFLTLALAMLGGLAVDSAQAWRVRTMLQVTAEAAAHAAAVRMSEPLPDETPEQAAARIVKTALGPTHVTGSYQTDSVEFGHVGPSGFQPSASRTAVRVTLRRTADRGSAEPTYLLKLAGLGHWDIEGRAVARIIDRDHVRCPDPLLSVQARVSVDVPLVYAGVCVMADAGFAYGYEDSVISDPVKALVGDILAEATGFGAPTVTTASTGGLGGLGGLVGGLIGSSGTDGGGSAPSPGRRSLFGNLIETATVRTRVHLFDPAATTPGETYHVECSDNGVLYLPPGTRLDNVVLLSDCPVKFGADVTLVASVVAGNLRLLATSDPALSVTRDAQSPYSRTCAPDGEILFLVYLDLDTRAAIPVLADDASPLGAYLNAVVDEGGGWLRSLLDLGGTVLDNLTGELVEAVNETTATLGLDHVCLGAETYLSGDTITLSPG